MYNNHNNPKRDLSKFDRKKFQDILDVLDTYRCGLELVSKHYEYEVYRDSTWNEIYYAGVSVYDSETTNRTKNSGFLITFYQNWKVGIYCKITITISGRIEGFNPRSIGARLGKFIEPGAWRREKSSIYNNYYIPFQSAEELEKIVSVFSKFLP